MTASSSTRSSRWRSALADLDLRAAGRRHLHQGGRRRRRSGRQGRGRHPEDDPRNPAVIADNVGDNVGDCAGMAADLFETYVVTVGATMVLIALLVGGANVGTLMSLPLLIGGVCILTSILGTYMVRLGRGQNIMGALYKGFFTTALLSIPAIYYVTAHALGDMNARHRRAARVARP
jgi:Na+/H+-translocating membrane pyrophosphatase